MCRHSVWASGLEDPCHHGSLTKIPLPPRHEACTSPWTRNDVAPATTERTELERRFRGLIAGALGLLGIAAVAGQIAWILFLVALVFLVIHVATGRRMPIQ